MILGYEEIGVRPQYFWGTCQVMLQQLAVYITLGCNKPATRDFLVLVVATTKNRDKP